MTSFLKDDRSRPVAHWLFAVAALVFAMVIVGLVGALIGKFLLGLAGYEYTGILPSLGAGVLGAVILLAILGLFHRRRGVLN